MTEQVNKRNKDIKELADSLVPCRAPKELEEFGEQVCPSCGKLFKDVPIVIWDGDSIRVYDKKLAVIGPQLYVAADGSDAIRILKVPNHPERNLSDIPRECIELFARPLKLSDDNQGEKEATGLL